MTDSVDRLGTPSRLPVSHGRTDGRTDEELGHLKDESCSSVTRAGGHKEFPDAEQLLAISIDELIRARRALRAIRDRVNADGDTPPGLLALIHSAVREGLGEDGQR